MKNKTSSLIILILTITLSAFFVISIVDTCVKRAQINDLKSRLENREFPRVTVSNDYWQYTQAGNTLYGNIFFDDISLLEAIQVTYKDDMFNTLEFESTSIAQNDAESKIVTSVIYGDERPSFAVVTVYYTDGRIEDITLKIAMG